MNTLRHVLCRRRLATLCAVACAAALALPQAVSAQEAEDDYQQFYVGAAASLALPQGGTHRMRRLGGASLRGGMYCSEFLAAECEVAWMENAAGFAAQGLWHWQGADLYGNLFGYSVFDPFFTFGARGWIGHGIGQVGPKAGVGAFWHLTDDWSLRADADATLCLDARASMAYSISLGLQRSF